jgi:acyl-CoA-binding protein
MGGQQDISNTTKLCDDDDALEVTFDAAADYVAALAASTGAAPGGARTALQLYSLYKQATVGPCTSTSPWLWQRSARAKWCVVRWMQHTGCTGTSPALS